MYHIVLYYFVVVQAIGANMLTAAFVAFPQLPAIYFSITDNLFRAAEKAFFAYINL